MQFMKKKLKIECKKTVQEGYKENPTCPRQDRPKWADDFGYSQIQLWKKHECFICLRGTIPKHFKRVRGFGGP